MKNMRHITINNKSYTTEQLCGFYGFLFKWKSFLYECFEQWLSSALPMSADEAKAAKVFPVYIWMTSSGP